MGYLPECEQFILTTPLQKLDPSSQRISHQSRWGVPSPPPSVVQRHGQVFVAGHLLAKLGSQAEEQAKSHTITTEDVRE